MSDVSERIERLEGTVERVQGVLDHVQRGLSTAEKTHNTARGVVTILRRAVMWMQNDLINNGRPENKDARNVIVHGLLHGFFTASVWVLAIAAAIVLVALLTGPYGWAVKLRGWVRSGAVATVGLIRGAAEHDATAAWVRGHLDPLRIGGGLLALLLILVLDVTFVWLLVILVLLAAYEFWLYRVGVAARTTATHEPSTSS